MNRSIKNITSYKNPKYNLKKYIFQKIIIRILNQFKNLMILDKVNVQKTKYKTKKN